MMKVYDFKHEEAAKMFKLFEAAAIICSIGWAWILMPCSIIEAIGLVVPMAEAVLRGALMLAVLTVIELLIAIAYDYVLTEEERP